MTKGIKIVAIIVKNFIISLATINPLEENNILIAHLQIFYKNINF